jgi:coenzyme F420-reducing hydrogenase gamma subunit
MFAETALFLVMPNLKTLKMTKKLKVGVFGIAGCAGCMLSLIYEDAFVELSKLFDIKSFPLIKEDTYKGNFDIIFLEGTVTFDEDLVRLNELRKRTKILVALGSCSCVGGVPSIRNFTGDEIMHMVYPKIDHLKPLDPTPINRHVKVDFYLPQCPPSKEEIIKFVKTVLLGTTFKEYEDPVCLECRMNQNHCLLEKNKVCLGPLTKGGCNAICPSNGIECYGCRGPNKDLNLKAYVELLKSKGFSLRTIKQRLETFAGLDFKKEGEKVSKWLKL